MLLKNCNTVLLLMCRFLWLCRDVSTISVTKSGKQIARILATRAREVDIRHST